MNLVVDVNEPVVAGWAHEGRPRIVADAVHGSTGLEPGETVYSLLNGGVLYNRESVEPLLGQVWGDLEAERGTSLTVAQNAWADAKLNARLAEVAFETLGAGQLSLVQRQLATAYALSKPQACLVVDIDHGFVSVVPVSNGRVLTRGVVKSSYGGDFLSLFARQYLAARGMGAEDLIPRDFLSKKDPSWQAYSTTITLRQFARGALTLHGDQPVTYVAPSLQQTNVDVPSQRDLVEPLFKPHQCYANAFPTGSAVGTDAPGIGALIFQSLKNLSASDALYRDLLSNVVIQGTLAYIPGLEDGILNDLRLYVKDYQISSYVNNDEAERAAESWTGACLATQWAEQPLSAQEWAENGAQSLQKSQ